MSANSRIVAALAAIALCIGYSQAYAQGPESSLLSFTLPGPIKPNQCD